MAEKKLTPEEQKREIALKNLKEKNLTDLAAAYLVNSTKAYGEAGDSAVEEFKYFPALNSGAKFYNPETGEEVDLIKGAVLSSRQDGQRYSGSISEYGIIKNAANILDLSLREITCEDLLDLIGIDSGNIKSAYKGKYIKELIESENEEEKKIAGNIIYNYMRGFTDSKVSEALNERKDKSKKNLETLLLAKNNLKKILTGPNNQTADNYDYALAA